MSKLNQSKIKFKYRHVFILLHPVEPAPKICLGSHSKVADICVNFLNTTSKVTVLEDHKFLVVGCLEFSISLFNRTVSAFPVDCFQMPSHQHHQKEEGEKKMAQDLGNWMPQETFFEACLSLRDGMPKDVLLCIHILDVQWFHIESINFSWILKNTQFQEYNGFANTNECYISYFDEHSISLISQQLMKSRKNWCLQNNSEAAVFQNHLSSFRPFFLLECFLKVYGDLICIELLA